MSEVARPDGPGSCPTGEAAHAPSSQATAIPRAKGKVSPECLIAEYLAAYKAAHNKRPPFRVVYVAGWVQFRSLNSSMVIDRKRVGYLATMTKRLCDQASA